MTTLGSRRLGCLLNLSMRAAALLFLATPALALAPDELLLIANRKVPQSEQLARFYAQQRQVPADRIVLLDLPTGDDMPGEAFDERVALPIREYLQQHQLQGKIRCLTTFYGTPLRLLARKNSDVENAELQALRPRAKNTLEAARQTVEALEGAVIARDASGIFQGGKQSDIAGLRDRATAALERVHVLLPAASLDDRKALLTAAAQAITQLGGEASLSQMPDELIALAPKPADVSADEVKARVQKALDELPALRQHPFDVESRGRLRQLMSEHFGLFDLAETLAAQIDYLQPGELKAFDSQLAMLPYDNYVRRGFLPNPLRHLPAGAERPPLLMVSRLDAPEAGMVRDLILSGILAQRNGLAGRVVIDSRGMLPEKVDKKELALAQADQSLRQLADRLGARTKLSLLHDDAPDALKASAATNVALYVGWYKVRNYTASCAFVPGAVAYHIASYEMISLHNGGEKGWCRGLLLAGAAATIGPVDEPYIFAFPDADEFFSLLLTGRLTLAESYWSTLPLVNWRMVLVGDPLYNPFANSPALKPGDLPEKIRAVLPSSAN